MKTRQRGRKRRSNFRVKMIFVIENCSTKMKDKSQSPFMWICCLPPTHARCLTLTVRHKMWLVDVHLGTKKPSLFICFQFHLNDSSLWSRSCSPPPSISVFISQFQSFILTLRIAPTQGRMAFPPLQLCSKIIITHIARSISG